MKMLMITASIALALSTAGCAGTPMWGGSTASGGTSGASTTAQVGPDGSMIIADPAGSATHGTGSAGGSERDQREVFSSGEGLD
jgi:hypothetical protein